MTKPRPELLAISHQTSAPVYSWTMRMANARTRVVEAAIRCKKPMPAILRTPGPGHPGDPIALAAASLGERWPHGCLWVIGDPAGEWRWCNCARDGDTYCTEHLAASLPSVASQARNAAIRETWRKRHAGVAE